MREEVYADHRGSGASYADGPCYAMDRQLPQLLAPSVLDVLMVHFCQQLLRKEVEEQREVMRGESIRMKI